MKKTKQNVALIATVVCAALGVTFVWLSTGSEGQGAAADTERPDVLDKLAKHQPMERLGTPEEIASAVAWLCSDGASFMTGHALAVDGGYLTR